MFLSKTDIVQLDMVPSIVDKVVFRFAVTISPSFFFLLVIVRELKLKHNIIHRLQDLSITSAQSERFNLVHHDWLLDVSS